MVASPTNIVSELKKKTGFFVVITDDIPKSFNLLLEQIKLSRCTNSILTSPCNQCAFCKEFVENRYYYIFKITKNKAEQNISIDEIRNHENYFYMKVENNYKKYFFVEEAESLSVDAQNHMLKILEEIPDNTFFFFLCLNINTLLPTILSRSKKLFLKWATQEDSWGDYGRFKNIYQYILDFWYSPKKRDVNLYTILKENILLSNDIKYEQKKDVLKFLLDRLANQVFKDCYHQPYLANIVEELIDMIAQLKYNVTLELYILNLYIKILKWKNLIQSS